MRRFARRSRSIAFAGGVVCLGLLAGALAGCHELPPVVPEGYIGSAPSGRSAPRAVYADEPMHPANRWFHRAYAPRDARGRIGGFESVAPWSMLRKASRVDRAELLALVARIEPGRAASIAPRARRLARADLLDQALRWRRDGDDRLADEHARAAQSLESLESLESLHVEEAPGLPLAPSLRDPSGEGSPTPRLGAAGVPYLVRAWRDANRRVVKAALVLLSPSDPEIVREVWVLERRGEAWAPRIERMSRERALRGEEPWISYGANESIPIRDPFDADHPLAQREIGEFCGGCHVKHAPARVE